jgi:hypothetical protein
VLYILVTNLFNVLPLDRGVKNKPLSRLSNKDDRIAAFKIFPFGVGD